MKTKIARLALLLLAFCLLLTGAAPAGSLYPVTIGDLGGYADKSGKIVIHPQSNKTEPFGAGPARLELSRQPGYVNPDGRYVGNPAR